MEYGITDNGFIVKPFEAILEEQKAEFRTIFGDDIDLSVESVAGAYCHNQSIKLAQLWELLGGLYANTDVNSATGVWLDRLATFLNVSRMSSTKTTVAVALWGDNGARINAGNLLRDTNDNQYSLRGETTLSVTNAVGIMLKVLSASENDEYKITINGTEIAYVAQADEDKTAVKARLKQLIVEQFPTAYIFDSSDDDILKFHLADGSGASAHSFKVLTADTLEIKKVASVGTYDCTVAGAVYVGTGELNIIVTNATGLDSVVNYVQGETGRDIEADDDFRTAIKTRQKNASGNEVAIQNAIEKLNDVEYVTVYSNRENFVDAEGRPPKCYEAVVIGGDEQEIAETIFDAGPAGVQAYGNTVKTVTDSEGFNWQIGFSRPVSRYVWLKIKYKLNSEEVADNDIENSVKSNIVSWADANISIGADLIYQKLFLPIYAVNGLKDVSISLAVTNDLNEPQDDDYFTSDITVGERELALLDSARISVEKDE